MERVDAIIRAHMNNDVALIRQVVEFILHGAERRRPALVLATARALGHGGERPHALAAAVELIHISLALHDDVTEASGGAADGAHEAALFGNAGNILLGDLLYTSAFRMIVDLDDMEVMRVLSDATNVIAEGEVAYREAARRAGVAYAGGLAGHRAPTPGEALRGGRGVHGDPARRRPGHAFGAGARRPACGQRARAAQRGGGRGALRHR